MGTHKSILVLGFSFKYITTNCSFLTDRLQDRCKTTPRQGICFSRRTLISEQLSSVEACETLFFHQQPSRHFVTVSELLKGSFHSRVRIILSSLSCLNLEASQKKRRKSCVVGYCFQSGALLSATKVELLCCAHRLTRILYHAGAGTASLTTTPMLKALLSPFSNFTTKPAMFLPPPPTWEPAHNHSPRGRRYCLI